MALSPDPRGIATVLKSIKQPRNLPQLPAPAYTPRDVPQNYVFLGAEDMSRFITDEGWQLTWGFGLSGYQLCGKDLAFDETDITTILDKINPTVVVVQEPREWNPKAKELPKHDGAEFKNLEALGKRDDIFKLVVLKDALKERMQQIGAVWSTMVHNKEIGRDDIGACSLS